MWFPPLTNSTPKHISHVQAGMEEIQAPRRPQPSRRTPLRLPRGAGERYIVLYVCMYKDTCMYMYVCYMYVIDLLIHLTHPQAMTVFASLVELFRRAYNERAGPKSQLKASTTSFHGSFEFSKFRFPDAARYADPPFTPVVGRTVRAQDPPPPPPLPAPAGESRGRKKGKGAAAAGGGKGGGGMQTRGSVASESKVNFDIVVCVGVFPSLTHTTPHNNDRSATRGPGRAERGGGEAGGEQGGAGAGRTRAEAAGGEGGGGSQGGGGHGGGGRGGRGRVRCMIACMIACVVADPFLFICTFQGRGRRGRGGGGHGGGGDGRRRGGAGGDGAGGAGSKCLSVFVCMGRVVRVRGGDGCPSSCTYFIRHTPPRRRRRTAGRGARKATSQRPPRARGSDRRRSGQRGTPSARAVVVVVRRMGPQQLRWRPWGSRCRGRGHREPPRVRWM